MSAEAQAVERAILDLLARRGPGRTICPSEAARAVRPDGDWRALMPTVRAEAARLAAQGRLVATRKGTPVDPATARGAIRLGLPRA